MNLEKVIELLKLRHRHKQKCESFFLQLKLNGTAEQSIQ